ncbi:LysR family transcriptional regulator [Rhodovulum sp. P5]|uniref:LysR family transcriptional regulator n=1 Tax=Rhodovulum sp. P5 TaxID=1564506 RepID=UPI0009DA1CFB|nr:LysR family transcriptional regulator [Rhodovulum sp. P5]
MIGIDLRDLEILRVVAAAGSFRKAGQKLGIGQSAVSRRVHKVEEFLGISVFERQTTGASLTYAGRRFVATTRSASKKIEVAVRDARTCAVGDEGKLLIALSISLRDSIARELLSAFSKAHPDVRLEFHRLEKDETFTRLSHREVDLGFVMGVPPSEFGDQLSLGSKRIVIAIADNDQWAGERDVTWTDLAQRTLLIGSSDDQLEIEKRMTIRFSELGCRAKFHHHMLGGGDVMGLVALGFGAALTADQSAATRYPTVSTRPILGAEESLPVSLAWRPENDNPALRRFISLARIEAKRNGALS